MPGYSVQPDLAPRAHAEAKRARIGVRTRVVEARNEHNLARRDKIGRQRAGPTTPRLRFLIHCYQEVKLLAEPNRCATLLDTDPSGDSIRPHVWERCYAPHAGS